MRFSLIFIAIHSIIFLSHLDLDQIVSIFFYSLVHSIVNLNKNQGKTEHKKHENILKSHLIVFPCFLWTCICGPVDTCEINVTIFLGPWIECFNVDWILLELAKLVLGEGKNSKFFVPPPLKICSCTYRNRWYNLFHHNIWLYALARPLNKLTNFT